MPPLGDALAARAVAECQEQLSRLPSSTRVLLHVFSGGGYIFAGGLVLLVVLVLRLPLLLDRRAWHVHAKRWYVLDTLGSTHGGTDTARQYYGQQSAAGRAQPAG